jgi:hypothetical protein
MKTTQNNIPGYPSNIDADLEAMWNRFKDQAEDMKTTTRTKLQALSADYQAFKAEQKASWKELAVSFKGVNQITAALEKLTGKK